jgi:hypothetical protein
MTQAPTLSVEAQSPPKMGNTQTPTKPHIKMVMLMPRSSFEWRVCPFTKDWSPSKRVACLGCIRRTCARFLELGLNEQGQPLPIAKRPECSAAGQCRNPVEPGCWLHGGASTGPRTPEGRAKIATAQKARWQRVCEAKSAILPKKLSWFVQEQSDT